MRTFTLALIAAAGFLGAAVSTGASAADPVAPAPQAAPQQAQYYPGYRPYWERPYWDRPYYYHHHHHGYPWWRYSEAEELNHQELQRLGVAP